ncbi:hypothetical protein SAMN05216483_6796 [Streptomyces sp. 2131.1]|uniref:hypothetical protein n=1 Tax=Streptomyces sp. 2131.1 TaxID=1855346 RepID=UPI00089750A2|nr:hypothetical protein [Streptomyces sp. 2131.1]SEE85277.1 hypothetical protein SAMN05216483_6796 [Streptomyces sp. 2131.1]
MTTATGRAAVFLAPAGTPTTSADDWTRVGYIEFVFEAATDPRPSTPELLVAEAVEEPR